MNRLHLQGGRYRFGPLNFNMNNEPLRPYFTTVTGLRFELGKVPELTFGTPKRVGYPVNSPNRLRRFLDGRFG